MRGGAADKSGELLYDSFYIVLLSPLYVSRSTFILYQVVVTLWWCKLNAPSYNRTMKSMGYKLSYVFQNFEGLIHEGDELKEVNGVPQEHRKPEEILPLLVRHTHTFKYVSSLNVSVSFFPLALNFVFLLFGIITLIMSLFLSRTVSEK